MWTHNRGSVSYLPVVGAAILPHENNIRHKLVERKVGFLCLWRESVGNCRQIHWLHDFVHIIWNFIERNRERENICFWIGLEGA